MKQQTIYRKNYSVPSYLVDTVDLTFDLDPQNTRVLAKSVLIQNKKSKNKNLELYGEDLELVSLKLNDTPLAKKDYTIKDGILTIQNAPKRANLEIETIIHPDQNTSLSGLYMSSGNFFTQCEAEGFRKITYFLDRPDVMAKYTVTLNADKKEFPILLSNGNLIQKGNLGKGRHFAKWEDPFKKPSYLFAVVAGKLVCEEAHFTLANNKRVLLQVWVEKENRDKTAHAMKSLQNSIRWDEKRFGLELDLDRFMIVAVNDFNMGAMENKGLNIFNTRYVLANPKIATDTDYANIESVVGHEYFHNWTGNRVTCRDWFQLSLKEGLTVFRDQEFSADLMGSETGRAVKRIEDVRVLRQVQFPEDASAMAHPVRPDSYEEINNFYTATVYEKGAEVVRMYQTLLGKQGFRKGMDLYFKRHDGQAVTCLDFLKAMAHANGKKLNQFENWYSQAGTPHLSLKKTYDAKKKTLTLTLTQKTPATPGQRIKKPYIIPFAFGLLNAKGKTIAFRSSDKNITFPKDMAKGTAIFMMTRKTQSVVLTNVASDPIISALRNFSAPVILDYKQTDEELALLLAADTDPFNRWESSQRLMLNQILQLTSSIQKEKELTVSPLVLAALRKVLTDETLDPSFRALTLTLPSEATISESMKVVNPASLVLARNYMKHMIALSLEEEWLKTYNAIQIKKYEPSVKDSGLRCLKNLALSYLLSIEKRAYVTLASEQYQKANNMTDRFASLSALVFSNNTLANVAKKRALNDFYKTYQNENLVVDKWFTLQAIDPENTVADIEKLARHKAFTLKNPNRVRSLIFAFCSNNMSQFHAKNGDGYKLWAKYVLELDKINPQIAARLSRTLNDMKLIPELKQKTRKILNDLAKKKLSRDTREIIQKIRAS